MIAAQTIAIARNTFREAVRDRVLYNLVAFAVILVFSAVLFGEISIGIEKEFLINVGLSSIALFGLLIAIFLGIGLVHKEIDKRSLYPLLSKPIRRWQFLLGKFLGLNLTLLVNTLFMSAGLWLALYYLTRSFHPEDRYIWVGIYFALLEMCLVTAICLFFSCFSTPVLSAIFTFLIYIVGNMASDIRDFSALTNSTAVKDLSKLLYYSLPNFSNFDVFGTIARGSPIAGRLILLNSAYTLVYAGVLVFCATMILSRKDLK